MVSDYTKIKDDNINGTAETLNKIGEFLARVLYNDQTHFIDEIIQNTEDALSRRHQNDPDSELPKSLTFRLYNDRLEVSHFGKPFDEADVRGICNILEGTKQNDERQIGKFGIGFKSVYAITSSPQIHSGDEHFQIEKYIYPQVLDRYQLSFGETVFVLPFNHQSKSVEDTFNQIINKLNSLNPFILLFLKHIDEISWNVEGHSLITCKREIQPISPNCKTVFIIGKGRQEWLVFDKPVEDHPNLKVEIAFSLRKDKETSKNQIVPVGSSPLVVFLPTEIQTNLQFLVQGPYNTTPARDNIRRNDIFNQSLIEQTAALVAEVLPIIREMGLLTVSCLKVLPIRKSDFEQHSLFSPVFDKVRQAFREEALLPTTHEGRFVSATQAKLARSKDFRQLILENQLQQLYGSTYTWVSDEITQGKTPEIYRYLTEELKIQEVEPEDFGRKFTENFINIQSDEWIACFYAFLIKQEALWRSDGILRNKPFIRLQNNKHVAPFGQDGLPNAYIPLSSGEETEFPIVKINILQNKFFGKDVKYFLQVLGFSEPDIFAEVVEKTIPKYKQKNIDIHDKIQHQKNIDKIIQALKFTALSSATQDKRKYLINQLKETPFIRSLNITTGKIEYRYPGNKTGEIIYFRSSNLEIYFKGNPNVWFLDESFPEKEQFEILGVSEKVKVFCKKSDSKGNIIISNKARNYQRGLNGFDPDCEIDGLEFALKTNPSYGKALFVWNDLLLPNYQHINGEVEKSTNQKFTNSQPLCTQYSKMGIIACKYQWLPDKNNVFLKPCELSIDDLNDDFLKNSKLANTLKLKPTETSQKIAKLLSKQFKKNIKLEDLEFMISNLDKLPQFKKIIDDLNRKSQQCNLEEYELDFKPNQNNAEFDYVTAFQAAFNQPGEKESKSLDNDILLIPIPNPKARGDKIINEIRDAQKEEPLKVERFKKIPTTRWESKNTETIRGFLKQLYDGQCQICEVTFPKQDGSPYFEGLYIQHFLLL